jgi:uncharacterized protein (TIGR02246 family)
MTLPIEKMEIVSDPYILAVLTEFAYRADQSADTAEIANLFMENAAFSMGGQTWNGRDAIAAGLQALRDNAPVGPGSRSRHILTNVQIEAQDDRTATARSCFLLVDASTTPNAILATGEYRDQLTRIGPDWLIANRNVVLV